jgi:cation transport regulator ChaC
MSRSTWVFGYGSLVSPMSVEQTIGRSVEMREGFAAARLAGYGRRWNYGSLRQRASWNGPHGSVSGGIVVSLGIVVSDEVCNGAVVRVTDDELALLDWRESDYQRTDVTDHVAVDQTGFSGTVVTYVPRSSAVERYQRARDERRAAVRQSYVELVEQAFADLGGHEFDGYRSSTPEPDVPVVAFESVWLDAD